MFWCGLTSRWARCWKKLEVEYRAASKLAKIDSDQQQQLAGMFGIPSIPTCVLQKRPARGRIHGRTARGPGGAFLDKHVP